MLKLWGIDISKYNYPIDFHKVKNAGVKFVIIRCSSYRNTTNCNSIYKDPYFENFYSGAKRVGLPVGVYFYSQCRNESEAVKEANFVLQCIKGKKFEYPIFLDLENQNTLKQTSRATQTKAVKKCLSILENNGYYVGLYSGKFILRDEVIDNELKKYDYWIAQYSTKCTYSGEYTGWQFGGEVNYLKSKRIPGIGSNVADQNYFYVDYPTIIKNAGLNGYKKEKTKVVKNISYIAINVRSSADWKGNIVGNLNVSDTIEYVEGPIEAKNGKTKMYKCKNNRYVTASSKYTKVIEI